MKRKPKIVIVDWEDSCHNDGWMSRKFARKDSCTSMCRSVGFILKKNKRELTLYQSESLTTHSVTEQISIPISAIKKIKRLQD